jgi:glycosyltransferase involved in cell wall biosynthesis
LLRLARPGNIIIAKTDPPMLSVVAAPIAWLRGAKLVNWLQDIFPEVAEALDVGTGRLSRSAYRVMRLFRDRSLRRAAMNVVLGSRMAERLAAFGVARERIYIISNWADGELIKPKEHSSNALRAAWGLDGKFVIGYSGNLGRAHEYTTILDAIADLEAQRVAEVAWLFIGGGALFESFKSEVRERRLTSVVFQPYQPRELLASSLSAADVHLVSLRPELEGLIVPSKFYGVAAAGRPTIFIGDKDGEIARLLTAHGCGVTVGQGEGTGLAQIVVGLARDRGRCDDMGRRARTAFEDHFGKAAAVSKWETMLSEL